MFKKSDNEVHGMSTAVATEYVRRMVAREASGPGDTEGAMARLEARYGIGFWQLSHLRGGRAKTVDVNLYARIRGAYLDFCERQMKALEHEIAMEKAVTDDDSIADLEREAAALAARIKAKRAARQGAGR